MRLEGKIFKANRLLRDATIDINDPEHRFSVQLEHGLIRLCHQLEIPLPLWMKKNTREFARFHQTVFFSEQFMETVLFERFQIRWIESEAKKI